jgi:pyridoxine/pyridoxamine 5'-phosphate oxidase
VTDQPDLGAVARGIVDANRYMALATADASGTPWVSPVWYAHADYRQFIWVSSPESRHSRNLATRPELAIVIFDSHRAGGWNAIYMSAVAEELGGADVEEGLSVFNRRSEAQGLRAWDLDEVTPSGRFRPYRATASEYFVLDPHDQRLPVSLP